MRVISIMLCAALVAGSSTTVKDDISTSVRHIKDKTSEELNKKVTDIKNKTDEMTKNVKANSENIFSQIVGYVKSVVGDIVSFFRMLFGDNTPGEPALADPTVAGLSAAPRTGRTGMKTVCLSLLGALMWYVWAYGVQRKPLSLVETSSYYRNFEEKDLVENFL